MNKDKKQKESYPQSIIEKSTITATCECPLCRGTGVYFLPKSDVNISATAEYKLKREAAKLMRDKGYSLREISQALGYSGKNNASAAQYLLKPQK